jgi:hypothetical protein
MADYLHALLALAAIALPLAAVWLLIEWHGRSRERARERK